jgi:acyl-CoA dehydrogenase
MDDLFSDAVRQLLAEQCTPQVVRAIEGGQPHAALWRLIEDAGFADALVGEALGGAGMGLTDVFPVWELCGLHALPLPLAETMLARAVLAQGGVARPAGSITFAQGHVDAAGAVVCGLVRSGRVADWVLVQLDAQTCLLPTAGATASPAGFVLDAVLTWPAAARAVAPVVPGAPEVQMLQACVYAALLAGALMSVFNRTLDYANERQQFGRPIGKFQAIQHQLSVLSEHTFAARMAAQIGCHADTALPQRLRVAVAKARASEAALEVAALSHAIHGAIGFTAELDLQLYTRRLHAWRQAGGSESYWHSVLGEELVAQRTGRTLELLRDITDIC